MITNPKLLLENVLTIIGYADNKNYFIEEFARLCFQKTLADYQKLLSENRRKELVHILYQNDVIKLQEQLEPYVISEEFSKLLQENSQKLFQDYLDTILPKLSEEQRNNLDSYLSELKFSQPLGSPQSV